MHNAGNEGDWGKGCEVLPGAYSVSETLWTQFSIQAEGCDGALAFNIQAVTLCYCS